MAIESGPPALVEGPAASRWRRSLASWAIPAAILSSAEQSPWVFDPELFDVPDEIPASPSHERAREALSAGSGVLDVGCGGGIAAFALVPPATRVTGVDQQPTMLDLFSSNAARRGVDCEVIEGAWPDVADRTKAADVVTAHHVVYNVGDIGPFLLELNGHARGRVVLELSSHHPLAPMAGAWRHFWSLERPQEPTATQLLDVLAELGLPVRSERWRGAPRVPRSLEQTARAWRIRLCLPASREVEVLDFLAATGTADDRELTTIWWDVEPVPASA